MGGKYTWTNADGLTQRGGPLAPDTGNGETQLELEYDYLAQETLGSAGSGEEADMLASGAVVGSTFLRTDIGDSPGTLYECFALPSTDASSWRVYIGAGGISTAYDTDAALQSAAGASELTSPAFYYTETDGGLWFAEAADTATPVSVTSARFRGRFTLAQINAISAPNDGDTAMASDCDNLMVVYDDGASKWVAMYQQDTLGANRVAGTTSASEQIAAGWVVTKPAGYFDLFGGLEVHVAIRTYANVGLLTPGSTDNIDKITFRMGTVGDATDVSIGNTTGTYLAAASNVQRTSAFDFLFTDTSGVTPFAVLGASGNYGGGSSNLADLTEVTLDETLAEITKFAIGVTMVGTTDTPMLTYILRMVP